MKKIRRLAGIAVVVAVAILGQRAQACGLGFQLYLPFFTIGFGFGLPVACAYSCAQPAYYYSPGVPAASASPASEPVPSEPPVVTAPALWTPQTPGAGHWVPDPEPYRYFPANFRTRVQTVAHMHMVAGVPVYSMETPR